MVLWSWLLDECGYAYHWTINELSAISQNILMFFDGRNPLGCDILQLVGGPEKSFATSLHLDAE